MDGREQRIAAALSQFASPYEQWDDGVASTITCTTAKLIVDSFLDQYRALLSAQGSGLTELLEQIEFSSAVNGPVLPPVIGALERIMRGNEEDPLTASAATALLCLSDEHGADWQLRLASPTRLRWRASLLPLADRVSVAASSGTVTVSVELEQAPPVPLALDFARGRIENCEALPTVGASGTITLLAGEAAPQDIWKGFDEWRSLAVPTVEPKMARAFQDAIDLLFEYTPTYVDWVHRAIVDIVVSKYKDGSNQSGSWRDAPGTIQLSWSPDPVIVAEALVHEASHQYAYHVYRTCALDDGSDDALYYSPSVGRKRPLERILFAYHAFANVLLFYREALSCGITRGEQIEAQMRRASDVVDTLGPVLRDNAALTAAGRSLYRSLDRALRDHGA